MSFVHDELEIESYNECISYINDTIEDETYALLCAEINNVVLVGLVLLNEPDVLYLPVELVEYATGENTSAFMLSPYKGVADYTSEIIFNTLPTLMFAPSKELSSRYYSYWEVVKAKYKKEIDEIKIGRTNYTEHTSIVS